MHRLVPILAITLGLYACANNDKKISSWEINDVYQSTIVTSNNTGGKTYLGPSINTMDDSNTYEMFNLRSIQNAQGEKSYELQIHLTYFNQMRSYENARLINGTSLPVQVISKDAGLCEAKGCIYKELLSIKLSDNFLKQNVKDGIQLTVSSKAGVSTDIFVPSQYLKGYLKAVDGVNY
jgi:hypothetical protein